MGRQAGGLEEETKAADPPWKQHITAGRGPTDSNCAGDAQPMNVIGEDMSERLDVVPDPGRQRPPLQ